MSVVLIKELRERTGLSLLECKRALAATANDVEKAIEELRKSSGMKAAGKAGRIAADGVVMLRVSEDNSYGSMVEINSETDFVARDKNFLAFAGRVADTAFVSRNTDLGSLMAGELESAREDLVQKIGENISVRRITALATDEGVIGSYVHGNNRIAVLVQLKGGDTELARDVAMHVAAVSPRVVAPRDMPEDVLAKEREILTAQASDSGKPPEIVEKMIGGRIRKFLSENSLLEQAFVKDPDLTVGKLVAGAGAEVITFSRYQVGEGIERKAVDFATEVAAQLQG
ncbi:MAG: translation elongation factor Ts [Halieaceae bacterium]|nr:translation elongation factor Ts [Halieaceae bacterium]